MRIIFPDKINDALKMVMPYVEGCDLDGVHFKKDTPTDIKDLHRKTVEQMRKIERQYRY